MAEPVKSTTQDERHPNPDEKLVKVFDSENESEGLVVKGLLESAGIDSDLTAAAMVQDTFPGLGGMIILVRAEDAVEARRVIAEYRQSPEDEEETAELEAVQDETIEEPPPKA